MRAFVGAFFLVVLLGHASCQKAKYEYDFIAEWKGTFKVEENFYRDAMGCVGSFNPCNGYGKARICISFNNQGGSDFYFYFNDRLVRKLVSTSMKESPLSTTYFDESGKEALTWYDYFQSEYTGGSYLETFPIGQDQSGQKYMNYFELVK